MNPDLALLAQETTTNPLISLAPLLLIFVAMYFLMIRPQQRRARAQRELVASIDIGDEVITIGGMYGTVTDLDDESVTVEVAAGTSIRLVKSAIARKLVFDEEYDDEDAYSDDEEGYAEDEEAGEER
ncbi:MAG: preprotein translocase subunit YajC [Actinobacteria bacterium]|nr:preprotein translocase subunit YajC [Actinomycetota bacterium]